MIRVLIVEDSPSARELLVYLLGSDPAISVIGTASDGVEAVEAAQRHRPDVITMDINMPRMGGFDATRRIMELAPTPIIIVSGAWDANGAETTFRTLEAGALAVVSRPRGPGHPEFEATARELIQMVKLMAEVRVVRRWPRREARAAPPESPPRLPPRGEAGVDVVAIGASTGGPIALRTLLSRLPGGFPIPLLIVQHMSSGFVDSFAEWLSGSCALHVGVAAGGEPLLPGRAYIAPDGVHLGVDRQRRIALSTSEPEHGLRPSVSYLFRSVAGIFAERAVGVLLTGMGKDGAAELKQMKERGAVTLVQDQASSVVFGMPRAAIEMDAATRVASPEGIATELIELTGKR